MRSFLPGPIRGALAFLLYFLNSIVIIVPLVTVAVTKFLIPFSFWQLISRKILDVLATTWIDVNTFNMWLMQDFELEVTGAEGIEKDMWYLVISNHQSWVDILILQRVLNRKIPFLKFFLKKELIWVPIMGLAWWAMDFPFMKRYSKDFLKKNPHLKGKDIEVTRKACEKYKTIPVSIVNFVEGTRFTPGKHSRQNSPFTHLLKPKAGGVAFVLGSMGELMTGIVNVTIVYPNGTKSFWEYLCGKIDAVKVHVELMEVTDDIIGSYENDPDFRAHFQTWINGVWEEKDRRIDQLRNAA
ncbi:acyltransferase [Desulfoluna spongiiphila]|uniref:1-acyl-sn-glycerol-3-phosphate acyltransferases n=1 Tax=Desulfoluna spongiiphila TaxID=419481 RepID=A0A1G5IWQ1_9BACT|nr:acyltransferase [Desulfoluna spongiiphila]SCY80502.1 1-acyl-sn-glycerol-3-phosphate acyltransferases [Desulfoluna spongiiphila]VVS93280.1 phospholipid/glycerol acyltransferase [Desulfoluna spongiiphila]